MSQFNTLFAAPMVHIIILIMCAMVIIISTYGLLQLGKQNKFQRQQAADNNRKLMALQENILQLEKLLLLATQRVHKAEKTLGNMTQKFDKSSDQITTRQTKSSTLTNELTSMDQYEHAIRLAKEGADKMRIRSICGISAAEAELILDLHTN